MTNLPSLEATKFLIMELFEDIFDASGAPYHEHCFRVEEGLPETATLDERHAALLHDVLEDTEMTADGLRELGYSDRVIELVQGLTHVKTL